RWRRTDGRPRGRGVWGVAKQTQGGGALIVGASSGMGAAVARQLVRQGYHVALVARRQDQLDALASELNASAGGAPVAFTYAHDVADYDQAGEIFTRATRDVAPLRLVIYAAGTMPRTTTGASFAAEHAMME